MVSAVYQGDNRFEVYRDGRGIGCISVSENPAHRVHTYLNVGLTDYDTADAQELFDSLQTQLHKPLQVMTYSDKKELCDFLLSGGFVCKRRCYEIEGRSCDLIRPINARIPLKISHAGEAEYEAACRLLFDHYRRTHEAISPLSADFEAFCDGLPASAVLSLDMTHAAFLENEEIAYVASLEPEKSGPFLETILKKQLSRWEKVCFECDDCDPVAMKLLDYFQKKEPSWNTFIREISL